MLNVILNIVFIILLPLAFIGVINKTKAFWSGRKGASIIQPYYDVLRLLKKELVISRTASFLFQIYPSITLAAVFMAALLIPFVMHSSVITIEGGFIFFAYIMAFGKFLSVVGAMDVGSSFEGMGASREASFSTLVEVAFFIIMGSIAAITSDNTFGAITLILEKAGTIGYLIKILSIITFLILILIEGCRIPVDDPNTHLELTMIHEVMILDNSGIDLAMLTYASALKMLIFTSLIANMIIPESSPLLLFLLLYFLIVFAVAFGIGTIESAIARLRMSRVFDFICFTSSLGIIMLALIVVSMFS
ncbi:MAG TPA: hydrogenase [Lentisphaeria bacterium]|nr:hydrogenase [Lentisphaeria bacterium]